MRKLIRLSQNWSRLILLTRGRILMRCWRPRSTSFFSTRPREMSHFRAPMIVGHLLCRVSCQMWPKNWGWMPKPSKNSCGVTFILPINKSQKYLQMKAAKLCSFNLLWTLWLKNTIKFSAKRFLVTLHKSERPIQKSRKNCQS